MFSDRRSFIIGAAALVACDSGQALSSTGKVIVRPEDFGALGNGRADDTAALQRCLTAAPPGAVVELRRGAVYRVNTNYGPTVGVFGGLKLKSGQTLALNGAELRALPTVESHGAVIQATRVSGWRVQGPGRITGERSSHLGKGGEWGMGLSALSSSDWSVGPDVEINNCWGDGLYVGSFEGGPPCRRFLIDRVHIWNCRRNGISVVAGEDGEIRSVDIHEVNGTPPYGGIDLEPNHGNRPNRNIRIRGGRIRDVGVGIYATVANENVLITDMDIEGKNSGIIIGDSARGIRIEANRKIRSLIGGAEGAAIRAVGNPAEIRGVHIRRNLITGGGYFVVDFWGDGYRDLSVTGNEIRADNPGVQGIARVHYGTFTDNLGVIGRAAGKGGDYFVHLQGAVHGRNRYRNLSPHRMFGAHRGGRDLGGTRYEDASLTHAYERCDDCDRLANLR